MNENNEPKSVALFQLVLENRLCRIGGVIVIFFILVGIFAPLLAPYDPNAINVKNALAAPSRLHLCGTDFSGRDLLSRIIYGTRVSLLVSIVSVSVCALIAVPLGILAGLFHRVEMIIMRLTDVFLCFPGMIVALTIIAILGPGLQNLIIAIVVEEVPQLIRLTYSLTLNVKKELYIEAATVIGVRTGRMVTHYILPNITSGIIVQLAIMVPSAIMTTAGLSFLGLGIVPPTAEWGALIQESFKWFRKAPHTMIYPGLALVLVVYGFNLLGDGLRVAADPQLRSR